MYDFDDYCPNGSFHSAKTTIVNFPNASQYISNMGHDDQIKVAFTVKENEVSKLAEFLGDPIVSELPRGNSRVYFSSIENDAPMQFSGPCPSIPYSALKTIPRKQTRTSLRGIYKRQTHFKPIKHEPGFIMDSENSPNQQTKKCKETVTLRTVQYYFRQLSLADQMRFLHYVSGDETKCEQEDTQNCTDNNDINNEIATSSNQANSMENSTDENKYEIKKILDQKRTSSRRHSKS